MKILKKLLSKLLVAAWRLLNKVVYGVCKVTYWGFIVPVCWALYHLEKLIPWPNLSIPAEEEKRIIKDSFIHF